MGARSLLRPPAPIALRRRLWESPLKVLVWSMNCESCEEPKNSFMALLTGLTLTTLRGVMEYSSWGVIRPRAHNALHTVHPDPERLLHKLPHGPEAPVAEVLVLVELVADALIIDPAELLVLSDLFGGLDEALEESFDVLDRQGLGIERHVELELLVELVAPDLGEVVTLGVEEQPIDEVLGVLDVDRLTRPLPPEDF